MAWLLFDRQRKPGTIDGDTTVGFPTTAGTFHPGATFRWYRDVVILECNAVAFRQAGGNSRRLVGEPARSVVFNPSSVGFFMFGSAVSLQHLYRSLFRIRRTPVLCALALAVWFPICQDHLNAQKVGDSVVVTTETPLKIKAEDVGKVYPGSVLKITHARGKWIAVEGQRGWLNSTFVMSLEDGLVHFGRRLQQNPRDVEALAIRGLILYHLQNFNDSIASYNQALGIRQDVPQLWNNRSLSLIAQSRFELAEKDLLKALELSPDFAEAHSNLGWVYSSVYQWEEAIERYNKAIELNPDASTNYVNRGSCYRALGELDKAMADFTKALELTVNLPSAFVGRSSVFLDRRDLDSAINSADKALQMDGKNVQALINRGWARYLKNQQTEALKDLTQAIALDQAAMEAYVNRSVILLQQKKWDQARRDLDMAQKLAPEDPVVWLNIGELELAEGEFAKSMAAFEKAVELAPEIAETQNGMAWILATAGEASVRQPEKAIELARKACEMSEYQDWSHLDTLAAAHANLGQFEEAIKWAQKALELVPDSNREEVTARIELYKAEQPFRENGK